MTLTEGFAAGETDARVEANTLREVEKRTAAGQVSWGAALVVLTSRNVLAVAAQAIVAGIYLLRRNPSPWQAAAPWWTVYGTLVDLGCLALMAHFTRREGIRLRDLVGKINLRRGHDILVGIGFFLCVFPFFLGGGWLAAKLVYGSTQPTLYQGLIAGRVLPLWVVVYSLSVWWIVWSATEEMTYQAYALPRIRSLSGSWWVAIPLVAFWFALQHSFLPLVFSWHSVVWRFLGFLPGATVMVFIYARTRRLPPLIVAHWLMDISGALITLKF